VDSVSRFPQRPNPADSWPAWTDAHTWELTEPDDLVAVEVAPEPLPGPMSVTVGRLADFYPNSAPGTFSHAVYVQWTIGDQLQAIRAFLTLGEARRYAASLWGEGGCADNESTLEDETLSGREWWLLTAGPEPEPRGDGSWTIPPCGGMD
jgi:hypothetical protein